MRFLKVAFWLSLAIWLGGGLLTIEYAGAAKRIELLAHGLSDYDVNMLNLRGISINLFGPLAAIFGLLLAGAWLYKRSIQKAPISKSNEAEPTAAPKAADRSPARTSPHPIDSPTVSCTFSG